MCLMIWNTLNLLRRKASELGTTSWWGKNDYFSKSEIPSQKKELRIMVDEELFDCKGGIPPYMESNGKKEVNTTMILRDFIYLVEYVFGYDVSKPLIEKYKADFNKIIFLLINARLSDFGNLAVRNWSEQDFFKLQAMLKDFREWMAVNKKLLSVGIWKSTREESKKVGVLK